MALVVAAYHGRDALGKLEMGLTFVEEHVRIQVKLADEDNIDEVVNNIVKGLKQAAADLKREKSGLIIANGALPDGLRKPQGG